MAASSAESTRMEAGRRRFMALRRFSTGIGIAYAESGRLFERVYAGVGAAGAGYMHRRVFDLRGHVFEHALDRG